MPRRRAAASVSSAQTPHNAAAPTLTHGPQVDSRLSRP
ncbi:hypothetical protein I550_5044 [Mycobacterium intracellulare 1956]|uniref:Uncharacterized protein n=1 Tax=Mycobacterium intracellulare 1956 TaxID=1299331 RepID=X8CD97_MYCIT|nr:hypothetical protein I550_5044 [Mycobacterium intracellulare 1956]